MAILRPANGGLALALASGVGMDKADLFTFTLIDGTVYRWTSYDGSLTFGGNVFWSGGYIDTDTGKQPWLERSRWNVVNTMTIPEMEITLRALNDAFAGGPNIKVQIHNGLFDGASVLIQTLFMRSPGSASLGALDIFGGVVAPVSIEGVKVTMKCRGRNNLLDQYAPREVYQISCLNAFCDTRCTLDRTSFTTSFTVGSGPTAVFIPWGSAPGSEGIYQNGTVTITSGAAAGQRRTIGLADATGLFLTYALYDTPAPGDTFDAFQGCDKTLNSGSGQSCTDRSNTQNFFAFPFFPPPTTAY